MMGEAQFGPEFWPEYLILDGDVQARDYNAQYRRNPSIVVQYFSLYTYFFQGNGVVLFIGLSGVFFSEKKIRGEVQSSLLNEAPENIDPPLRLHVYQRWD